jgi:hypothetical protein
MASELRSTDIARRLGLPRPTRTLNILAALVWHVGGLVLLFKGGSLLMEAAALEPDHSWPWVAGAAGTLLGGLKAKLVFIRSCRRNLDRIASLENPRIWQFFSPRFFAALAAMILAGVTLSRAAKGSYPCLLGVATLDLGIAVALLASGSAYWKAKAFASA